MREHALASAETRDRHDDERETKGEEKKMDARISRRIIIIILFLLVAAA